MKGGATTRKGFGKAGTMTKLKGNFPSLEKKEKNPQEAEPDSPPPPPSPFLSTSNLFF